jgi:Fe-Mn family superoxide dismutase
MTFTVPVLPYGYDALEPYISKEIMQLHHDKHHQAYVDKLNKALESTEAESKSIEEIVKTLDEFPEPVRVTIRNNAGGHYNHSLFWQVLSPHGGGEPDGELMQAIVGVYGSFQGFIEKFRHKI